MGERKKAVVKEATQIFAGLAAGKITNLKSQQKYINALNRQYNLDGEGRVNSREKHKLVVRTIRYLVASGTIGTTFSKCGNIRTISRNFMKLVALHVHMEQVGVNGKMLTNQNAHRGNNQNATSRKVH